MANCVICQKNTNGFYDYDGAKIPVCFKHYDDGTLANYLATRQEKDWTCKACTFQNHSSWSKCYNCHAPRE